MVYCDICGRRTYDCFSHTIVVYLQDGTTQIHTTCQRCFTWAKHLDHHGVTFALSDPANPVVSIKEI